MSEAKKLLKITFRMRQGGEAVLALAFPRFRSVHEFRAIAVAVFRAMELASRVQTVNKSAVTGKFVKTSSMKTNPKTTYRQKVVYEPMTSAEADAALAAAARRRSRLSTAAKKSWRVKKLNKAKLQAAVLERMKAVKKSWRPAKAKAK